MIIVEILTSIVEEEELFHEKDFAIAKEWRNFFFILNTKKID